MSSLDIWQSQISPSNYNTVVRQDNELEGSKGNSHLKTVQHTSFKVAYTWMPCYQFSLNASVYWEAILKDIVPYWHEQDGLMVNEKSIAGTPTRFTSTSSLRPICSTASCSCRPRFRIAASGTPVCTI